MAVGSPTAMHAMVGHRSATCTISVDVSAYCIADLSLHFEELKGYSDRKKGIFWGIATGVSLYPAIRLRLIMEAFLRVPTTAHTIVVIMRTLGSTHTTSLC